MKEIYEVQFQDFDDSECDEQHLFADHKTATDCFYEKVTEFDGQTEGLILLNRITFPDQPTDQEKSRVSHATETLRQREVEWNDD